MADSNLALGTGILIFIYRLRQLRLSPYMQDGLTTLRQVGSSATWFCNAMY